MQLQRGLQFAPGYRLQEFLGRGQFGQVWRASVPGGTASAVKFIDLSDGQGQKEYDGIRRVKQIRQANLMPITAIWLLDGEGKVIEEAPDEAVQTIDFSLGVSSDQSAVVMLPQKEASWLVVAMLLGGKSLQHRLRECVGEGKQGIPPKELISLMDDSAKGLDYLNSPIHDLGDGPIAIQHCDVKPANIVFIGNSAVVCDFGLARILTRSQATATSASGTPAYMAPEAIEGKPSRTSDQYSLAITYYQLRTGTLPVNEGSLWQVLDSHRQGKLNYSLVPQAEQAVLRKATSMNWEHRYETNVDMVDALRDALRGGGLSQPSFATPGRGIQSGSAPQIDQSRLTSPVAGTGGVSLAVNAAAVREETALDPTATIGSELFGSRESSGSAAPAGLFGSPELLQTMEVRSSQESTQKNLESAIVAGPPHHDATISQSFSELSKRVLVEASKRPRVSIAGASGVLLTMIFSAWMLFSRPSETTAIGTGGAQTDLKGNGKGGEVVVDNSKGQEADSGQEPILDSPQLFQQARSLLAKQDEAAAVEIFNQAIKLDPGLSELQPVIWNAHTEPVTSLLFSTADDGSLVTLGDFQFPKVWPLKAYQGFTEPAHLDLQANEPAKEAGKVGPIAKVGSIALSPNGERLLACELRGGAKVWSLIATESDAYFELVGHEDDVLNAAWHPSGKYVVTSSLDQKIGIWELADATTERKYGAVSRSVLIDTTVSLDALVFDDSGDNLAVLSTAGGVDAYAWKDLVSALDTPSAPKPRSVKAEGDGARKLVLAKNSDGTTVVVVAGDSKVVTLWALESPAPEKIDAGDPLPDTVDCLRAMNVDGTQLIAAGSNDGTVTVWRRESTNLSSKSVFIANHSVVSLDLSSDGKWLAAVTNHGSAALVHLDQQAPKKMLVLPIADAGGMSIKLDPNGRWLFAGTHDGKVYVYDLIHIKLLTLALGQPAQEKPASKSAPDKSSISAFSR